MVLSLALPASVSVRSSSKAWSSGGPASAAWDLRHLWHLHHSPFHSPCSATDSQFAESAGSTVGSHSKLFAIAIKEDPASLGLVSPPGLCPSATFSPHCALGRARERQGRVQGAHEDDHVQRGQWLPGGHRYGVAKRSLILPACFFFFLCGLALIVRFFPRSVFLR